MRRLDDTIARLRCSIEQARARGNNRQANAWAEQLRRYEQRRSRV